MLEGIIINLTKLYKLIILQAYALTPIYKNNKANRFYENTEVTPKKHINQFSIVLGDFNIKLLTKNALELQPITNTKRDKINLLSQQKEA